MKRRTFLRHSTYVPGLALLETSSGGADGPMSSSGLAEWSLHNAIRSPLITNLGVPGIARSLFSVEKSESVNAK